MSNFVANLDINIFTNKHYGALLDKIKSDTRAEIYTKVAEENLGVSRSTLSLPLIFGRSGPKRDFLD